MDALGFALAFGLAAVHVVAGKLRFLDVLPRSAWLSGASGASVAYVFLHLLPELAEGQEPLGEAVSLGVERHVWIVALLGLSVFYGLERIALTSRDDEPDDTTPPAVFWLHIASFGFYNVLIGYLLLHRDEPTVTSLLLFALAMGLHFLVNDYGLRQHHKERYDRWGRWLLAAAAVGGCALGLATDVSEAVLFALIAFLGGGVVLNVLKEELPEERASRFWPFALGVTAYAALLLAASATQ